MKVQNLVNLYISSLGRFGIVSMQSLSHLRKFAAFVDTKLAEELPEREKISSTTQAADDNGKLVDSEVSDNSDPAIDISLPKTKKKRKRRKKSK